MIDYFGVCCLPGSQPAWWITVDDLQQVAGGFPARFWEYAVRRVCLMESVRVAREPTKTGVGSDTPLRKTYVEEPLGETHKHLVCDCEALFRVLGVNGPAPIPMEVPMLTGV